MKVATIRTAAGTSAVRVDDDGLVGLRAADVGALLADPGWRAAVAGGGLDDGTTYAAAEVSLAPVVPRPGKIICVGLNYRTHITEMGRELPQYPALFAKYPEALVGATDPIWLPPESGQVDWEAELAIIIGRPVRRASPAAAETAIAGFCVLNDVTARDWQYRSPMWLQGKTFEGTSPVGPMLVTPDELPGGTRPVVDLTCLVNGEVVQETTTGDLLFSPVDLVRYISTILTLQPGDIIASGTPQGVGHARRPARYLVAGDTLVTRIEGLGSLTNVATAEEL